MQKINRDDIDRAFQEFVDQEGDVRIKIHPSDAITNYEHMHLYVEGYSLSSDFQIVERTDAAAHIEIAPRQSTPVSYTVPVEATQ